MKFPRYYFRNLTFGMIGSLMLAAHSHGSILVNLEAATALYDSDIKGIANDGGTAGSASGIPLLGAGNYAAGFTFNITFTPLAADLNRTRLLIEIGGLSNGAGIYLVDGVPTLLTKQSATDGQLPTSLNDTTLAAVAVQSSIGKLQAGISYSVSASWNHAGTLELKAVADGQSSQANDSFAISGPPGNWVGNSTISVKTLARNNAGGLSGGNTGNNFGHPFDVDDAGNFTGTVTRALFWNANAVTARVQTAPEILGFRATQLPSSGKLRLHWSVSEGGLANPTTVVITDKSSGSTVFTPVLSPETTTHNGFVDLSSSVANFAITATNNLGTVSTDATVEQDTPFSTVIRADSPSAWYRFNDAAGARLSVDSADNAAPFNGSISGQAVAGAVGFIDGAASFASGSSVVNERILNPAVNAPEAVTPGFTVEAIVRRNSGIRGTQVLLSQTDVDGTGRVFLGIRPDGTIYSFLGGSEKAATAKLPEDTWSHVVVVYDATAKQLRWYFDGKPAGATTGTEIIPETSQGKWVIGSAKGLASDFWNGTLDDLAVFPRALDRTVDGNIDAAAVIAHRNAWYAETSGILNFTGSLTEVSTGNPVELIARVGADVTAVSISPGIGSVPVVDGVARISIFPTAATTYQLTATGAGTTYTASYSVGYNQLTPPVVYGFETTSLPIQEGVRTENQVRIHWKVTPGDYPTTVNVVLKSGDTVLLETPLLKGHLDIAEAAAVNLTLGVTNSVGSASATATAAAPDTTFSAVVRADKPVAWFRFNESQDSAFIVDSADNTAPHNGELVGPAVSTGATGFIDGAGNFGGASGIVSDLIVNPDLITSGYTIEAIVKNDPGTTGTNRMIVANQDLGPTGRQLFSIDDNGVLRTNLGGGTNKTGDGRLPARAWSHVVQVVDFLKNEIRWYIDGELAGSTADGLNPDGTTFDPAALFEASKGAWTIGVHKTLTANFWKGQIDDIAIYNSLLDSKEIVSDEGFTDYVIDLARVKAHRDAWWHETSGLLYSSVSTETINQGQSVTLSLKFGADATTVTINGGIGNVPLVNGNAVVTLSPSATTTYEISVNGVVVKTITITVNGGTVTPLKLVSSAIENGNFVLNFQGAASTAYLVRGSVDLVAFNEDHGTATTDASGAGRVSIPIIAGKSKQFFRIESQP